MSCASQSPGKRRKRCLGGRRWGVSIFPEPYCPAHILDTHTPSPHFGHRKIEAHRHAATHLTSRLKGTEPGWHNHCIYSEWNEQKWKHSKSNPFMLHPMHTFLVKTGVVLSGTTSPAVTLQSCPFLAALSTQQGFPSRSNHHSAHAPWLSPGSLPEPLVLPLP